MARRSVESVVADGLLVCPACRVPLRQSGADGLTCAQCTRVYPVAGGAPLLLADTTNADQHDVQQFWRSLYEAAYAEVHEQLSAPELERLLGRLEELFRHREHLAAVEMPAAFNGELVLEIGSGAGAHSAVFARRGARMVSLDLTLERVIATGRKLDLLAAPDQFCVQGSALDLPFPDNSFDIVYSNGVLHHTPDVPRAVREVHRVLKPGGRAVIMLYARNSFLYRGVLFPVRGILQGGVFRDRRWLGKSTEWMSGKTQVVANPFTEVFSSKELQKLFAPFGSLMIRKNAFTFSQIPGVGRALSAAAGRVTGHNEAGVLVYDEPWRNETALELMLGRWIGWGMNIVGTK